MRNISKHNIGYKVALSYYRVLCKLIPSGLSPGSVRAPFGIICQVQFDPCGSHNCGKLEWDQTNQSVALPFMMCPDIMTESTCWLLTCPSNITGLFFVFELKGSTAASGYQFYLLSHQQWLGAMCVMTASIVNEIKSFSCV